MSNPHDAIRSTLKQLGVDRSHVMDAILVMSAKMRRIERAFYGGGYVEDLWPDILALSNKADALKVAAQDRMTADRKATATLDPDTYCEVKQKYIIEGVRKHGPGWLPRCGMCGDTPARCYDCGQDKFKYGTEVFTAEFPNSRVVGDRKIMDHMYKVHVNAYAKGGKDIQAQWDRAKEEASQSAREGPDVS